MAPRERALVTGASRGIGADIARRLARSDYHVVLAARNLGAIQALAEELQAAGARASALSVDLSKADSIASALERLRASEADEGPVACLINNAGIAVSSPLLRTSDESVRRHMEVNFHGPRHLIEALLPGMLTRGSGRIVNIASSAGLVGYPYVSAYCASKHALVGYCRAAAAEIGVPKKDAPKSTADGVRIHVVCPHYVDSPMLADSIARLMEKTGRSAEQARSFFAAQNPSGKLVAPEQVAEVVAELCEGDGASQIVELDGAPISTSRPIS